VRRLRAAVLLSFLVPPAAQAAGSRADWMPGARAGVIVHYLADWVFRDEAITVEKWNAAVEAFDAEGLAKQLESVRAPYLFITVGQGSGYYLAPSAAYDAVTGLRPSHASRRDLVSDLHAALRPRGIRLLVYATCGPPGKDEGVAKAFDGFVYGPVRNPAAMSKWEGVLREWSQRWATKVEGWWLDGCHWPNLRFRTPEAPNFESLAAAARAGNPNAVVAFNAGLTHPIISVTPHEDYTAGVVNAPGALLESNHRVVDGKTDGARLHMMSHLGKTWGQGPPRETSETIAAWTRKWNDLGGVVTWDVPVDRHGRIAEPFLAVLRGIHDRR
jgi:hypothetical protein